MRRGLGLTNRASLAGDNSGQEQQRCRGVTWRSEGAFDSVSSEARDEEAGKRTRVRGGLREIAESDESS